MSPEQVRGEKLDARTDLFSFGLVLYEMATGQRAFTGDTAPVLHEAILHQSPVPPRQVNPGLPSGLERIVGKALEKDRQLRYQHAREIRDDLKRMASKTPRRARRDSLKAIPRNPWLIVSSGVLVLLLVVGGFLWLKRLEPPLPPPLSQRQLTTNSSENPVSTGAISPDGRYLAYADLLGIHVKLIATGEAHTVPQPESLKGIQVNWGIINGWVPDGTHLIANAIIPGKEPSVWIIPVIGGAPHKIRDDAYAGAISRDGSWVAFIANPGEIGYREMWMMRPDGTDAHKLFEGDANSGFQGAEWSPDSQRLSFEWGQRTGGKIDWNMVSRDLKGGPAVIAIPGGIEDWSWSPDGRMIYSLSESNSAGESCNFWAVEIDNRTGRPTGPAKPLTNWAGFCMDNPSATLDGKRLSFRRWSPQGSVYIADLEDHGTRVTPPKRLTLNEGRNYPASWTIDNKAVIFGSYRDGRWRIYKQALNGDSAEAIETGADEDVAGPRLSPDGKWIFYIALPRADSPSQPLTPSPVHRLMGVPISGGSPRFVMTADIYGEPHCSRLPATICAIAEQTADRRQLIFTAFDVNGRIRELLRFNTESKSYFDYVWDLSPDGTRIAILKSSESLIRILSLRDESSKDVVPKDGSALESVNWAADGKGFFASSHTKEGLVLLHLDQQGNTRVIWEQKGSIAPWNWPFPQWVVGPSAPWAVPSPDGRHLAIYEWSLSANMWMMENF
jgi:eukaryotic-like serine/threonine-protein kinase